MPAPTAPSEKRAITQEELETLVENFVDHFQFNSTSIENLTGLKLTLPWSEVAAVMKPLERKYACFRLGVKFHFGLDEETLRLAMTPLIFLPDQDPERDEFDVFEGAHYEWTGTTFALVTDWTPRWRGAKDDNNQVQGYIDMYYEAITVDRLGTGFEALDPDLDPCAGILPWEDELLALFQQNSRPDDEPERMELVIAHCADEFDDLDGGIAGMRHGLCFHMVYDNVVLMDSERENPVIPYHFKAANLVHPCPPRCKKYANPNS